MITTIPKRKKRLSIKDCLKQKVKVCLVYLACLSQSHAQIFLSSHKGKLYHPLHTNIDCKSDNTDFSKSLQATKSPIHFMCIENREIINSLKEKENSQQENEKLIRQEMVDEEEKLPDILNSIKRNKYIQKFLPNLKQDKLKEEPLKFLKPTSCWLHRGKIIKRIHICQKPSQTELKLLQKIQKKKSEQDIKPFFVDIQDFIIQKRLYFKVGDLIIPELFEKSEQTLMECDFIRKVNIEVRPVTDYKHIELVDVWIFIEKEFPISFVFKNLNLDNQEFGIRYNNLFGLGHQLQPDVYINRKKQQKLGWGLNYEVDNLFKSFVDLNIRHINTYQKDLTELQLQRNFIHPELRYVGGVKINKQNKIKEKRTHFVLDRDDKGKPKYHHKTKLHTQKIWVGSKLNKNLFENTAIILTSAFGNKKFKDEETDAYYKNFFYDNRLLLVGLTWLDKRSLKENFINELGSIENIDWGSKVTLISGYEFKKLEHRSYWQCNLKKASYLYRIGYLATTFKVGSFLKGSKELQQTILKCKLKYFSNLWSIKSLSGRTFIIMDYKSGYNMFPGEILKLDTKNFFHEIGGEEVYGLQRYRLNLYTLLINSLKFIGFNLLPLLIIDNVCIYDPAYLKVNRGKHNPLYVRYRHNFYQALGVGLRIKNDFFKIVNFSIVSFYYPFKPEKAKSFNLLSNLFNLNFNLLKDTEPKVMKFR